MRAALRARLREGPPLLLDAAMGTEPEGCTCAKTVRSEQRRMPRHGAAPVMAGDDGRRFAQGIEDAHHVAHEMKEGVLVDRIGAVGLAVAAHVRGDGMVTGFRQCLQLMSP